MGSGGEAGRSPSDTSGKPGRPLAVIECPEAIACNPCEASCKFGAITVGEDITALPRLDPDKCTGCGQCVRECPGLAIFLLRRDAERQCAEITLPFELPGPPAKSDGVSGLDRGGSAVCEAEVIAVSRGREPGETSLVTISVPIEFADIVRSFGRAKR